MKFDIKLPCQSSLPTLNFLSVSYNKAIARLKEKKRKPRNISNYIEL